jgi:hypothetical protein
VKQIGYIASETGAITKYDPKVHAVSRPAPQAGPLTKAQRATLFFKALRVANSLLHKVGFTTVADCGHSGFCIEMGGFILEMMVKDAPKVAHVTSYPGYTYDSDRVTAKVEHIAGTGCVIQITGSFRRTGTLPPTLVTVRDDSEDPTKEAFRNILIAAQDLIQKDPVLSEKILKNIAKMDMDVEYNSLMASDCAALPPS